MTARAQLKIFMLRALARMDGLPMPQDSLLESARQAVSPRPALAEAEAACRELELDSYVSGARDDVTSVMSWTLTEKGRHKAQQLG